jgi:hypothetical protein
MSIERALGIAPDAIVNIHIETKIVPRSAFLVDLTSEDKRVLVSTNKTYYHKQSTLKKVPKILAYPALYIYGFVFVCWQMLLGK